MNSDKERARLRSIRFASHKIESFTNQDFRAIASKCVELALAAEQRVQIEHAIVREPRLEAEGRRAVAVVAKDGA